MGNSNSSKLIQQLEARILQYQTHLDIDKGRLWIIKDSGLSFRCDPSDEDNPIMLTDYSLASGFDICQRNLSISSGYHDRHKFPQFYADLMAPDTRTNLQIPIMHSTFRQDFEKMSFKRDYGTDVEYMTHSERCGEDTNNTKFYFDECLDFFAKKGVPKMVLNKLESQFVAMKDIVS